jgi:TrmH family RNA methyltransferase
MSATQKELKKLRALLTKKGRREHNLFTVEGVRFLEDILRLRCSPTEVFYSQSMLSPRGEKLLRRMERRRIDCHHVSAKEFARLADSGTPQGILGLFPYPETQLSKLYRPTIRKILWCENISDPGNLGTLIRSAAAFEIDMLVMTGSCAEPFAPKVVRSSAGTILGLKVAVAEQNEMLELIVQRRMNLIAAGLEGTQGMSAIRRKASGRPIVLAVGSEAAGLSETIVRAADFTLRIAHSDRVESLNAAVAGSILMEQIYNLDK